MIDRLAIATNGYISIQKKIFSIAVDGYYDAGGMVVIPIPITDAGDRGDLRMYPRRKRIITEDNLKIEDDEIFAIIQAFIQLINYNT